MSSGRIPSVEGGIQPTIVDAKGDLIVATAADTVSRLAVGSNDQVLTADSSTSTGLKWAAAAAGGMTLITTTTFNDTASTYTYSSLGSYKHLMIVGDDISMAQTTSVTSLVMQFNSVSTGTPYTSAGYGNNNSSFDVQSYSSANYLTIGTRVVSNGNVTSAARGVFYAWIYDYAGSTKKQIAGSSWAFTATPYWYINQGFWNSTNAITSLTIFSENASNLKTGTLKLYGVS